MLPGILLACLWFVVLVFAMAESALAYASRAKLGEAIESQERTERYVRYLERCAPVRPFCVIVRVAALTALVAIAALEGVAEGMSTAVWQAVATGAAAVVAEVAGRLVGKRWGTVVLLALLPPLQVAWLLALPVLKLTGTDRQEPVSTRDEQVVDAALEEIRVAIEDAATEGAIQSDEKDMIEGVLEFEDVEVHEIMTPRTEIEAIEVGSSLEETLVAVGEFHHSRVPVYEEVRDKVVGILHVKDLLAELERKTDDRKGIAQLMRRPFFVPETKHAVSLLREFKQRHLQIAIILDEYGGVTGLVTLEDVMEQIVGELEEGFEAERIEERIRTLGGGALDVDARLRVDELNDLMNLGLPEDEDYDTVGGFMMAQFASVPENGEELRYNGALLRVLDSDDRRVHRVLVQRLENEEAEPEQ